MFEKKAALTALAEITAREKAELDSLEEHFAKVDSNNAQRLWVPFPQLRPEGEGG